MSNGKRWLSVSVLQVAHDLRTGSLSALVVYLEHVVSAHYLIPSKGTLLPHLRVALYAWPAIAQLGAEEPTFVSFR